MKDDLISRQALREEILRIAIATDDLYGMGVFEGLDRACKRINSAPSIKATPVVHGRWVNSDIDGMLTCSNCKGCDTTSDYLMDTGFSFCPNCGAKMYGGEEDVAD